MGLFRRKQVADPVTDAKGFWLWWAAGGAADTATAVHQGPEAVAALLGPRVGAIAPRLRAEVHPGPDGAHLLVVTAAGDPELRLAARRWLNRAPRPADQPAGEWPEGAFASGAEQPTWTFADLRPAVADLATAELPLRDGTLALRDVQVAWQRTRNHLDVWLHHPALADQPVADRVSERVLDAALGERDATVWLGRAREVDTPPADAGSLAGLQAAVAAMAAEFAPELGRSAWARMTGRMINGEVRAAAMVPLHHLVAPQLDDHVSFTIPVGDVGADGFPSESGERSLQALAEAMTARLGASGCYVGDETTPGRRVLHFYVDSTTTAKDYLRGVAEKWPQGKVTSKLMPDPLWTAVAHLRS